MSSPGGTLYRDSQTGQYYTLDRNGNRQPAIMQASPSRPRTINSASQYPTTSPLHGSAGMGPPTTQERRQSDVLPQNQYRLLTQRAPSAYPTSLSSSYDSTALSDSTFASPMSQTPSNQWTPNTSLGVRSVQACPPNYLTAVPTSSIRSTDTAYPPYASPAGTQQSERGAPTPSGKAGSQATQRPPAGSGGQASHGENGGRLPHREELDPSYKLRAKSFFVRGRVLLTVWSEPEGQTPSRRGQSSGMRSYNKDVYTVAFRQFAFSKVRRFIVLAEGDRSCTALAISTHCGTGAAHMQHDRSQYGVVYTGSFPPQIAEDERGMQAIPIRVDPDSATTSLDSMSRIHYGKLYTIEQNFRVSPYGMVNQASLSPLMRQFQQVNGQRFGFSSQPVQTLREEWTPPNVTSGPGQTPQRPTNPRQLLPPQYQRAMARHQAPAPGQPSTQPAVDNAQNVIRAPQPNVPGTSTGPTSNTGRPAQPPVSDEDLRRRGFNDTQIRSIREMMARGLTAQYAIARTTAMWQLRCTPEAANRIAQAVERGVSYASAVAQFRALEAQATQQRASAE